MVGFLETIKLVKDLKGALFPPFKPSTSDYLKYLFYL